MKDNSNKIVEVGYIEKGTGKHQSNIVYGGGGVSPTLCAGLGIKCWVLILDKSYERTKQNQIK